ncbi:hypothetical protein JOF56_009031 [Kibdelosporangium banguiense]|uniref:Exo-alpha-sialidase n=1 Tax=Kibdelosporangium banguiense TaxID=1365924 RepID=A0ABS4TXI2_9PSEU|nr:sialidase family protein [Kibdelosporangium banguiense]MBP2328646.1 hypothetical protein [Kibdelosporangium banguiense]
MPVLATYAAADPRPGRQTVYLVWQDTRFSGGVADAVVLSRSDDAGRTWSEPVQVSPATGVQAFTPAVTVDWLGRVTVVYYDFTYDTATDPLETDLWLTRSFNGGRNFQPRQRITPSSFDMRAAPAVSRGFFVGDNPGITRAGTQVFTLYSNSQVHFPGSVTGPHASEPHLDPAATGRRSPV